MKFSLKIVPLFLALLMLSSCGSKESVPDQEAAPAAEQAPPKQAAPAAKAQPSAQQMKQQWQNLPEELKIYVDDTDWDLTAPFYPLGWSKKNHIAFIKRQAREAMDGDIYRLYVQNLVNDSLLVDQLMMTNSPYKLDEVWKENQTFINEVLKAYEIVPAKFQLKSFPGTVGRSPQMTVVADLQMETGISKHFGFKGVQKAHLSIIADGKRRKTIDRRNFKFMPMNAAIAGYLESPYDDRIVVVVCLERRGYEGPPHTKDFYLVGAGVGGRF